MITGFNTEIKVGKKVYHIQTEDKGEKNPVIETLIYVGGEIIDAYRTSYQDLLKSGLDKEKLKALMMQQHNNVIASVKQGKYLDPAKTTIKDNSLHYAEITPKQEKNSVSEEESLESIEKEISKKTLDQVILEYLEKHSDEEKLIIETIGDDKLIEGKPASLILKCFNSANNQPIPKTKINIKIISTIKKPIPIFDGFANEKGELNIDFVVPEFAGGNAAIVIQGFSNIGNYEIKRLIIKPPKKS